MPAGRGAGAASDGAGRAVVLSAHRGKSASCRWRRRAVAPPVGRGAEEETAVLLVQAAGAGRGLARQLVQSGALFGLVRARSSPAAAPHAGADRFGGPVAPTACAWRRHLARPGGRRTNASAMHVYFNRVDACGAGTGSARRASWRTSTTGSSRRSTGWACGCRRGSRQARCGPDHQAGRRQTARRLIVLASRGRSGPGAVLRSSLAERTLRGCRVPLLAVRALRRPPGNAGRAAQRRVRPSE